MVRGTLAEPIKRPVTPPKVDGRAFRPAWLINSRLLQLAESGRIGRTELDAAETWRRWFEAAARPAVTHYRERVDSSLADQGSAQHRLDPVARLHAAGTALGPDRLMLLHLCVVEDRSWQQIANRMRFSDKTALVRTIEALEAPAAYLAGEPVPPPPGVRFRNQPSSL